MQEEEKRLAEEKIQELKKEEEEKRIRKTFGVKISFLGEYLIEVKAADYRDAAKMLEGETGEETEELLEQAIRLDIGKAEINDMLEIDICAIVSIEVD